jgi:hypothetical protein
MRSLWLGIASAVVAHGLCAQALKKVATIDLTGPKGERFDS